MTSASGIANSPSATLAATASRTSPEQSGGDRGQPQVDAQRGAARPERDPAIHTDTSFRRRTSQMKNGAPTSAVTIPTPSSAGRAITRPRMSADSSTIAPSRTL